ncbi:MAG: DUF4115 domain-containing protein [Acidobacteriota bacterium]
METRALDLKSEREKRKISLEKIAAETRISLRYLRCIEENRFVDLPGGVYNRAFIKAYCESINLDPQEVLQHYDTLVASAPPEKNSTTIIPIPSQRSRSIPVPVIVWSIMLLVSALCIYWSRGWIAEIFSPYFTEESVDDRDRNDALDVSVGPEPESITRLEDTENEPVYRLESGTMAPVSAQPDTRNTDVTPETVVSGEQIVPAESLPAKLILEINARERCWISIEMDESSTVRKLMEAGDTDVFKADKRLKVLIGNAGGVHVKINDKTTKSLGNTGEVIRMDITPENFRQFIDLSEESSSG